MKDVCTLNQNITDKFKHLDDEQYQSEYKEHCRKMNIIDSYEDEIKEVLFLSSGCVNKGTHSYQQFGLGMKPEYISLENLVDKIQHLKATKMGLKYRTYSPFSLWGFVYSEDGHQDYVLDYIGRRVYQEYTDYLIEKVNHYSKEFYNKEYFLRCEGSFMDSYYTLVTKDETWKMEYLRHPDTLKTPLEFTLATLLPVFGWLYILYSMYEAVKIYLKHKEK